METPLAQQYLDIAGVMIVALDRSGRITLINRFGCEILGSPQQEILGRDWIETFVPERLRGDIRRVFEDLMAGRVEGRGVFENPVLTASGEERTIAWRNSIVHDKEGRITGLLSSGEDVTERQQALEALRKSKEHLSSISSSLAGAMIYQVIRLPDGSWRFGFLSDSVRQFYGVTPEEGLAHPELIYGRVHEEDRPRFHEAEEAAYRARSTFRIEARIRTPEGGIRWSSFVSTPREQPDGSVEWDGIEFDITERQRMEETLQESEERFQLFLRHFPGLAYVKDSEGRCVYANEGFQTYLSLDPHRMVGKRDEEIFPPDVAQKLARDDRDILDVGGTTVLEEEFAGRSWVSYKFGIAGPQGRKLLGGIILDVTGHRKLDLELRQKVHQMTTLNEIMLTREQRVLEVKKEVNALLKELGRGPKYAV